MRTWLIVTFLMVGLVTVAVPVCTTGVCGMAVGVVEHGMEGMTHAMGPVVGAACNMAAGTASVVEKALPPSSTSLLIGLFAALALASVSLMPRLTLFRLPVLVGDPPAPPGDPRGVCLLI